MYKGQTYRVPQVGGWNANSNYDHVPKEAMVDVENFNVHRGGRQPRGGSEKVITTAISGAPEVLSLFHFIRENGTIEGGYVIDETDDNIGDENGNKIIFEGSFVMTNTDDGKLYKNYTAALETGLTTNTRCFFENFYDECLITNGVDAPRVWTDNEDYAWLMGTPKQLTAALAGAGAGNVEDGAHYYKVTFVTAVGESCGGEASAVLTVADKAVNGQVSLSTIEVGPTGTTSRIVYRTEAGGSDYKLLTTLSDNTTTTYTDNTADAGLGAAIPTTNLAFLPTDWGSDPPKYFIKHGRSTHKRLWAIGCKSYPNNVYVSKNGIADFNDDDVIVIKIMTDKLTAMIEFGGDLLVFSRDKTYIIDDRALSVTNWGVYAAPFEGGAAHQRLVVKTPNDVAVMDESGNIFSIKASQQYGDYESGSLTKPHHIDKWIEENVDLILIDKFHATYDPELRAIKWFMCEVGYNYPNMCLVYFIDYVIWTRHDFTNIFNDTLYQLCSGMVKVTQAVWKIYTGDEAGFVYKLESKTLLDGGNIYEKYYKTPPLPLESPRMTKQFDKITTVVFPKGTEEIRIENFIDNDSVGTLRINMDAASTSVQNVSSDIGRTGLRIQQEISNKDANNFFISEIMIDFEALGSGEDSTYDTGAIISAVKGYTFSGYNFSVYLQDSNEFHTVSNSWASVTDMPNPVRAGSAASVILNDSYVYGGVNTSDDLLNCDRYNPSDDSWASRTNIPSPERSGLAAATIYNLGYIFGGLDNATELGDCDEYNLSEDSWANKTAMGSPTRYYIAATELYNNGYVYGGYDGTSDLADCDKYTQSLDSWSAMTSLPSPTRPWLGASVIDNKGYVYGGYTGSNAGVQDCDEYDSILNAWTNMTNMPSPARQASACATTDDKGYSYGGSNDGAALLQDCDEFDASGNAWTSKTDMSAAGRCWGVAT